MDLEKTRARKREFKSNHVVQFQSKSLMAIVTIEIGFEMMMVSRQRVVSLETQTPTNEAKITVLQHTLTHVNMC